MHYTNIKKTYGMTYWSIGNETNIYAPLKQADYDYSIDHLNKDWRADPDGDQPFRYAAAHSTSVKGIKLQDAEVWLLDATHLSENLGMQTFAEDGMVVLPAQSATLYVIN